MRLSAVVMAHPAREHYIPDLMEALGEDLPVVWDEGWNDRHITGRKAMQAYDPDATHHLVIQDDVIVSRDLLKAVSMMIEHSGEHPIGLYCGKVRPNHNAIPVLMARAKVGGYPWFAYEGPWWGPGIVMPTVNIDACMERYQILGEEGVDGYDRRISRWHGEQGIECWYACPSLLDHRTVEDHGNQSLVFNRTGRYRGAYWFIGSDRSGADTDWSVLPEVFDAESKCEHGRFFYQRCPYCGRWK